MPHLSENSKKLTIREVTITDHHGLMKQAQGFNDVCILRLPFSRAYEYNHRLDRVGQLIAGVANALGPEATLITLGEVIDLVAVQPAIGSTARFQSWIAIKRLSQQVINSSHSLPHHHFGALIHTRYNAPLRHTKTRIGYTYCPVCDKTTKDYGGKKHTYHEYGTLMSDVWRDVACDFKGDLSVVNDRFADFFGIGEYRELRVLDCRLLPLKRFPVRPSIKINTSEEINALPETLINKVFRADCLTKLQSIPENSIDFAFADPPYNLGKEYNGYSDDLEISKYFEWCDKWIAELARVLKPGRTCAILNIPLWAIRHFLYLETVLDFQNWIVWDALSFPVRLLMPSHYAILCFSKGISRALPGFTKTDEYQMPAGTLQTNNFLNPLAEWYCLRAQCVAKRKENWVEDRGPLTDVWWDVHRLKHNTRRVDHPCQLPPQLMCRLISLFTEPGEVVLDCFNGAGTTTLTAHQLSRKYIGIEKEETYHKLIESRHKEITNGIDPFRKEERVLNAKNSPVPRMPKQKYEVSKKTLQLEVKRVAELLGRLPTREELKEHGKYHIEYYDKYFVSWGEVCAAARTTGMSETRTGVPLFETVESELLP